MTVTFFEVVEFGIGFVFHLLNVKFQLSNFVVSLFNPLSELSFKIRAHTLLLFVNTVKLVLSFGIRSL